MEYTQLGRAGLKVSFKKDELKQIDEIWPDPGGEAPEAYAW